MKCAIEEVINRFKSFESPEIEAQIIIALSPLNLLKLKRKRLVRLSQKAILIRYRNFLMTKGSLRLTSWRLGV